MKSRDRINYREQQIRKRKIYFFIGLIAFIVAAFFVKRFRAKAVIEIKVLNAEIRQGEKLPEFKAKVKLKEPGKYALKRVIIKSEEYTVSDLIDDLKKQKIMQVQTEADGSKEGKYKLKVELSPEFQNSYKLELDKKVNLKIHNATLTVKNKYGDFDGDKFIDLSGKHVKNKFVESKGNTYYFGKDGKMVKGDLKVDNACYHFDKKGVLKKGFIKDRYFKEDGKMAIGWEYIDGKTYYFNSSGKMLTGKHKIGPKTCFFNKKGVLIKEEGGVDKNKPMIAITFDDGPGENTMRLLKALEENGARATFFMTGTSLQRKDIPVDKILKYMIETGSEPANHTMTHKALSTLKVSGIKEEVTGVDNIIRSHLGFESKLLRPPYGDGIKTKKVIENVNLPMIYWSVDTQDWKTRNALLTKEKILNAGDGDIVLLHDIHPSSVDAAISAIPKLIEKGYQIVTVSEMAQAREETLIMGETYFDFYKKK